MRRMIEDAYVATAMSETGKSLCDLGMSPRKATQIYIGFFSV